MTSTVFVDYTTPVVASWLNDVNNTNYSVGAKVWGSNQSVTPVVRSITGTVTPDASTTNNFQFTLTGPLTIAAPTNLTSGMVLNFCVDQDAVGGRVLTLNTLFKFPGGVIPTWSTLANTKNFFSAYYDGTILRCSGGVGYA